MYNEDPYLTVFHQDGTYYQSHQVYESSIIEGTYTYSKHTQFWWKIHKYAFDIYRWKAVPKEEVPSVYRTKALLLNP